MSELRTNRIVPRDGLPSGSSGGIIQIKSTTKTDTFTTASTSFTDVTGLSVSITPTRADSKIFVLVTSCGNTNGSKGYGRLMRDSTAIDIGTAEGNRPGASFTLNSGTTNATYANKLFNLSYFFLDSPSTTSATTYKIQLRNYSGDTSRYYTINRTENDSNVAYNQRGSSKILLMEVSG